MSRRLPLLLVALLIVWGHPVTGQTAYDAPLPAELTAGPDLCAYAPCRDVLPGAERFSLRKGRPAYVEAFGPGEGDGAPLVGYVFLSTDIVDIPAYSGKPVVTLIGMDTTGAIVGTRILKHSEPILLVGIPETQLTRFVNQFIGRNAWDKVEIGRVRDAAAIGIDGISGATVTVIAQNQVMMRSAYQVARQVGIVQTEPRAPAVFTQPCRPAAAQPCSDQAKLDWAALVREGSVQRLRVTPADIGDTSSREPVIDIHFGYLNMPVVGRSVLGEAAWTRLMERLGPHDHAIFLIANGRESFKGSGFVRGGIYDRVQVAQDIDTYTFRDSDYLNLYGIQAAGAPAFSESAIFIVRGESFSAAYPWSLVFLANTIDRATGQRTFASFDQEYWLHAKYLVGGRPRVTTHEAAWVTIWRNRLPEIAVFVTLLVGIAVAQTVRDRLTRAASRQNHWPVEGIKFVGWVVSIGFVGFYLMAQPSITQVLTWFHGVVFDWNWELFLSEPFIFLFWLFILITVFIWGRGLFCGWLCPFGSLSEILHKIGGVIGLGRFQFKLPMKWHDRLKWVKYAIFLVLLVVSFFSMTLAETLAEVEPFKTTFLVGIWNRSWPFALFAGGLLGLSMFIERPFCKYLCPLGASLAMPSTFRWIGLRRKPACNSCAACAVRCGSQAIDKDGRIDHRECLLCLECMILYTDTHTCPPLVVERKRREKAGLPLTPIAADGHYIPLTAVASGPAAVWPAKPKSTVDPRMQTDPVEPAWEVLPSIVRRASAELRHHFWPIAAGRPWSAHAMALAALAGAVVVLALAIARLVPPVSVLGAALLLSFWEARARMASLQFVKEGPWWRHQYRVAKPMDMLSYVGFKNLMVGAVLFLLLKSLGLLVL